MEPATYGVSRITYAIGDTVGSIAYAIRDIMSHTNCAMHHFASCGTRRVAQACADCVTYSTAYHSTHSRTDNRAGARNDGSDRCPNFRTGGCASPEAGCAYGGRSNRIAHLVFRADTSLGIRMPLESHIQANTGRTQYLSRLAKDIASLRQF